MLITSTRLKYFCTGGQHPAVIKITALIYPSLWTCLMVWCGDACQQHSEQNGRMEERKKKDTGDTVHLSCEQCHFCTTAETSCREVGLNEHFFYWVYPCDFHFEVQAMFNWFYSHKHPFVLLWLWYLCMCVLMNRLRNKPQYVFNQHCITQ